MTSLLLFGFLIGMRHALEADHVAAVATLSTHSTTINQAIKLGFIWGFGHTITLFLFGSMVLLTDLFLPESMANWLEFVVGIMLILLGLDVLRRLFQNRIHYHVHEHRNQITQRQERHFHAHSHGNQQQQNPSHKHQHLDNLSWRALFIGILHGLAGSAALILLTLETIQSPLQGILYIALFGFGSIIGMTALSCIITIPLRASATGMTWMHNGLQIVIGSSTLVLGGIVILENTPY